MTDVLRDTLPTLAAGVQPPTDLLARVEAGAVRLRRHRRWANGSGTAVALLLIVGGALAVSRADGPGPRPLAAVRVAPCSGPQLSVPAPSPATTVPAAAPAPTPGNLLGWPCRGGAPVTFGAAFAAWQQAHAFGNAEVGPSAQVAAVEVGDRQVGVFQFWPTAPGALASTVVFVRGQSAPGLVLDAILPRDLPGLVVPIDDGHLLVLTAPDSTLAGGGPDGVTVLRRSSEQVTFDTPAGERTVDAQTERYGTSYPTAMIPDVTGLTVADASARLAGAGLRADRGGAEPTSTVASTSPARGFSVRTDSVVVLSSRAPTAAPSVSPGTGSAPPLDPAHPWAPRGDAAIVAAGIRSGLVPLWAGRVGPGERAVLGLVEPQGSGSAPSTALLLLHADGSVELRDRQVLGAGTRVLADLVPAVGGGRAQLLVLGPPTTGGLSTAVASPEAAGSPLHSTLTLDLGADHGAALVPLTVSPAVVHVVAAVTVRAPQVQPLAEADVPVAAAPASAGPEASAASELDPLHPWVLRGSGSVPRGAPSGFVPLWRGPVAGARAAVGVLPDGAGPGQPTVLAVTGQPDGSIDVGAQAPLDARAHAVAAVVTPLGAAPVVLVLGPPGAAELGLLAAGSSYTGLGELHEQTGGDAVLVDPARLGFPAAVLHVAPLDAGRRSLGAGEVPVAGYAALKAPLSAQHPWPVRGDAAAARGAAGSGGAAFSLPLWAGRLDSRAVTVELAVTGSATSVVTDVGGKALRQPLPTPTDAVAVVVPPAHPGGSSTLLVLGPPGGRAAADLPGAAQAAAQGDDGVSVYPLPPGTTSYTGTVSVSTGAGPSREVHVDTRSTTIGG